MALQHAAQSHPGLTVGTDARCRSPASSRLHCSHCHTHAAILQPQQLHRRAAARQPLAVCAGAQQQLSLSGLKASNSSKAAELKSRIADLAGSKNGNDLPPERHAEVKQLLQQLESMNPARKPATVDLAGTTWKLVYTTSTAASSGKLGPFVGLVQQEFPASQPDQYINWVAFGGDKDSGFFRAKLVADYSVAPNRDDKLNVEFIDTTFMLGPIKFTQKFPAGRGGWWRLTYVDDDYRILYANTENVFVLAR